MTNTTGPARGTNPDLACPPGARLQADAFEEHRRHLLSVAYRMLGSRAEAEDAVQEAWLRYAAAKPEPHDLRGWLTTVTARICLDVLRSARVRRAAYPGQWLPEPMVNTLPDLTQPDPADRAAQTEQVSLALLVVLERLTPEQRVAFVLHDVFAVPFDEIATALDTTTEAARQLASRGRRAVNEGGAPRHTAGIAEQRRVLEAFFAAIENGDLLELAHMLAPDVVVVGDGGGIAPAASQPVTGVERVARFLAGLLRQADRWQMRAEPVLVNGTLGLLFSVVEPGGARFRSVMALAIADGKITAIYNQLNPEKLAAVPELDPDRATWPPRF